MSLIVLGVSFSSCNSLKKLTGKSTNEESANTEELTAQDGNSNYFAAQPENQTVSEPVKEESAAPTAKPVVKEEVVKPAPKPEPKPEAKPAASVSRKISIRAEKFTFDKKMDEHKNSEGKYFVILGSFGERANADRFKKQLSAQGFKPFVLLSETGNIRVCVNSYNSENSARARVVQIRTDYSDYADAWLLIKN